MNPAPRSRTPGPGFDTWQSLFGFAYRGLAVGACLGMSAAPLVAALTLLSQPARGVPFLLTAALPIGPTVSAACWAFDAARRDGSTTPVRDVARGLRRVGWQALAVWALALAVALVVYVDVLAVAGTPYAALVGPLLAVLALVTLAATPVALVLVADRPDVSWWRALRAAVFTVLHRPLLSLLTLAVLAAWALIVLAQPVLGVLALGGFALLLVQADSLAQLAALGLTTPERD